MLIFIDLQKKLSTERIVHGMALMKLKLCDWIPSASFLYLFYKYTNVDLEIQIYRVIYQ